MAKTRGSKKRDADDGTTDVSTPKRAIAKAAVANEGSPSSVAEVQGDEASTSSKNLVYNSSSSPTEVDSKPKAKADEDALEKLFLFSPTAKVTIFELIAGLSEADDFLNAHPPKVFFVRYGPFAYKSFLGVDVIAVGLDWREKYSPTSNYPLENILVCACVDDDDMMSHRFIDGENVVFLEKGQASIATSVHPPPSVVRRGSTVVTVEKATLAGVSTPPDAKKISSSILSLRQKCMEVDSSGVKRYVYYVPN